MVSTRNNANNNQVADEQIALIQDFQAQMDDIRQKGIEYQLRNEEDRHQNEEEVLLLKEQNKELKQRLDGRERKYQS